MEIFADERATLLTCHPTIDLARRFDLFRADLFRAGFDVMMDRPQNRAKSFRWMGERAESRGDIDGAIVLYELAVRSWNAVGCKKRLGQLIKETRR